MVLYVSLFVCDAIMQQQVTVCCQFSDVQHAASFVALHGQLYALRRLLKAHTEAVVHFLPYRNVLPYSHSVYVCLPGDSSGCGVNMGRCQPITIITTCMYFSVEIFPIFVPYNVHCLSCYK